ALVRGPVGPEVVPGPGRFGADRGRSREAPNEVPAPPAGATVREDPVAVGGPGGGAAPRDLPDGRARGPVRQRPSLGGASASRLSTGRAAVTDAPVPSSPPGIRRLMIHGPRGEFRWTAYALAATSFAAAIPTPLYPLYEERLHFSAGVLGLAFAAYTPGVFLTLFFLAPHAEQLGRKNLLYVGMAFTILAAVVFESASGVLWLALARFIAGFAVGATTSVATAAMSDL